MDDVEHDGSDQGSDVEGVLELNFVPDWARKPPQTARWDDERSFRGGRGRGRYRDDDRSGRGRGDRGRRDRSDRRPRRPREDRRDDHPRDGYARPPAREERAPYGQPHAQPPRHHAEHRRPREPAEPALPLDIRIIPDQKGIQAVSRRIHHSWMAYPVMELATIFLSRPELTRVRIEVDREARDLSLYQCQTCSAVSRDEERAMAHILGAHLEDYYEKEETLHDPPSGTFVCVARCGMSGEILGPPNHHRYAQRVQEVHDSRYPGMDMEDYRRRIETVRDEETIEKWKEESRKQTVYRRKETAEDATPVDLERDDAIREFKDEIAGTLIRRTRRASVPASVALYMDDIQIRNRVRRLWEDEERFPLKISFALRAAFKHMHLNLFKAGKGIHFVTRVTPSALDPDHVVEGIREVLLHLHDHPGISRAELLEALRPGQAMDSEAAHEVLSPLSWLIERGHIIEFFNGTLSVPLNTRTSRPSSPPPRHGKRRKRGKR
ncbi:MAG: hypothetical protein ISS31_08690 [Kiritimatiellae bacterium]|nr:hypothetical protein [Kiritimatiellia bacterium]